MCRLRINKHREGANDGANSVRSANLPALHFGRCAAARRLAHRIVERQLQAEGARITHVPYARVRELASEYLSAHPELLDQATEIVRANPKLRAMAEVEERQRQRQLRKFAKSGVLDAPKKSGTDKPGLFSTTSAIFRAWCLLITY